jgi:sporulation protein YlmC with PRC-barrel domain
MRTMLLTSAIVLALATPAYAAGNLVRTDQPAATEARTVTTGGRQAIQGDRIEVTSAARLLGHDIRSRDGRNAGRLDSLVLDFPLGRVTYGLIASGGDLAIGYDRIVVPFEYFRSPAGNEQAKLTVNLNFSQIQNGRRINEDQLARLADQDEMNRIYGSYGGVAPGGVLIPPSDKHPYRYVLVGPKQLTMLGGPGQALAKDVRDSEVQDSRGDKIGEIDQIMIDPATGRIPYLLLASNGSLGNGRWLPVPTQAMMWSAARNAFVLADNNVEPIAMPALHKTRLPADVQRSRLQALYERFNLKPYWNTNTAAGQG